MRLPVLLTALYLGGAPVSPASRAPIEVRWEAPPTCPDETAVRAAVEHHLGRRLAEIQDRRLSIIATAHPAESRWSLTIFTVTQEGTQERSLQYHSCSLLADAAALLIAMSIDPQVLGRLDPAALELLGRSEDPSPVPEPAPSPVLEPAPAPVSGPPPPDSSATPPELEPSPSPPASPRPAPTRRRLDPRGAVRASGSLGYGDLPSAGGGLSLGLALRLGRFQAELLGGGWFLRSIKLDLPGSAGAVFDLWALALRGGYVVRAGRRFEAPLLVGLEAGQIHVRGVQLANASIARTPWVAIALSPGVAFVPRPFLAIVLGVDLLVPVTRPRFLVNSGVEIFRPQPVGFRTSLGLEFRFPNRRSRLR